MMSDNIEQLPTGGVSGASGNKNEIKITAEGVARLTFNYLDEMQGDCSLEPGEVKSPIITNSPAATISEISNLESGEIISPRPYEKRPTDVSAISDDVEEARTINSKAKTLPSKASAKSASQLDAAVCEEKVRAILELDAVKRREAAEKRKDEKVNAPSETTSVQAEQKRQEKEERKRLKRIKRKKEQQAARLSLLSDEDMQKCLDDEKFAETKLKLVQQQQAEAEANDESEGLYSSGSDSTPERTKILAKHKDSVAAGGDVIGASVTHFSNLAGNNHMPPYPSEGGPGYMPFRAMNPFMRGMPRVGGGFMSRGRGGGGGMRGNMRFPGYRPPFFPTTSPRHHNPPNQPRQTTPSSIATSRRHSPIRAPNANVLWTKAKPGVSYSFNGRHHFCAKEEQRLECETCNKSLAGTSKSNKKSSSKSKRREVSSETKRHKKANKHDRVKKSKSSKNKKASKEKIELIRMAFEKTTKKSHKKLKSSKDKHKSTKEKSKKPKPQPQPLEPEPEPEPETAAGAAVPAKSTEQQVKLPIETKSKSAEDSFDMFADSPAKSKDQFEQEIDDLLQSARLATQRLDATHKELKHSREKKKATETDTIVDVAVAATPAAEPKKSLQCKASLQKALETQKRIDKLLQEDDLQLEALQAKTEKLMKETKRHNQAVAAATSKAAKSPKRDILTPEKSKNKNPFKRALLSPETAQINEVENKRKEHRVDSSKTVRRASREREQDRKKSKPRSRSRSRDRKLSKPRSRSRSRDRTTKSAQRSANKSKEEKEIKISNKGKSPHSDKKLNSSNNLPHQIKPIIPAESPEAVKANETAKVKKDKEKEKEKEKVKKKNEALVNNKKSLPLQRKQPVSFSASEFLFPGEGDDDTIDNYEYNDENHVKRDNLDLESENNTLSSSDQTDEIKLSSSKPFKVQSPNEESPDTNDYIDNWEHDDDADEEASTIFTPISGSTHSRLDDKFEARFANPSPPLELMRAQVLLEESTTRATKVDCPLVPKERPPIVAAHIEEKQQQEEFEEMTKSGTAGQLFGMQEIYEEFMKSVSESDVQNKPVTEEPASSSGTTDSEPPVKIDLEDANRDEDKEPEPKLPTASEVTKIAETPIPKSDNDSVVVKEPVRQTKDFACNTTSFNEFDLAPASDPLPSQADIIKLLTEGDDGPVSPYKLAPPSPQMPLSPVVMYPGDPDTQTHITRDFKKLRNLNASLKRIRKMRLAWDTCDDIEEELSKMERLFMQEKFAILQRYLRDDETTLLFSANRRKNGHEKEPPAPPQAEPVSVMKEDTKEQTSEVKSTAAGEQAPNKIFDSNREAIKLTISPMKLPKTSAVFKEDTQPENEEKPSTETGAAAEDKDFTEWLAKPPGKEIAIVKPMMESKESRESSTSHHHHNQQRHNRHRSNSRSPYRSTHYSGRQHRDRDRYRRSSSRTHSHGRYNSRGSTLSVSPPRRGRHVMSPTYNRSRLSNSRSNTRRSRSNTRRSRSRSRSSSRPTSSKRPRDFSPPLYRKRRNMLHQQHGSNFRRKRSLSRSHSRSPNSPRGRKRYLSRSPLPFKPPSPPMRRSMSPTINSGRDKSNSRRSPSPHSPRSPRSPQSPCSPRSPPQSPNIRMRRSSPQFFGSKNADVAPANYYYNEQPGRISLDARINIVLNGPPHTDGSNMVSYGGYTNYGHYSTQQTTTTTFMSMNSQTPPPNVVDNSKYYRNDYMPNVGPPPNAAIQTPPLQHQHQHQHASHLSHTAHAHQHQHPHAHAPPHQHPGHGHAHQQMYSNIPTISSADSAHYYYNDFEISGGINQHAPHTHQRTRHQSTSLLKELPKAPSNAVQKGNVLEIVPSAVDMHSSAVAQSNEVIKNSTLPSQVSAAVASAEPKKKSNIKKSRVRTLGKRVRFEDGIIPNHDSADEDENEVEARVYRRLRRKLKLLSIDDKSMPPPPPPSHPPPPNLPQPIDRRPPNPPTLYFFHWDGAVNSMYFSQTETPIPPRLFNPKLAPVAHNANGAGNSTTATSSLYPQSHYSSARRDGGGGGKAMLANRAIRGVERIPPRPMTPPPSSYSGHTRRESPIYHTMSEQRTSKPMATVGAAGFMRQNSFVNMRPPPQTPFARSGYSTQRSNVSQMPPIAAMSSSPVSGRMNLTRLASSPSQVNSSMQGSPGMVNEFLGKMPATFSYPPQLGNIGGSPTAITPLAQQNYSYYQRPSTVTPPQMQFTHSPAGNSSNNNGIGAAGMGMLHSNVPSTALPKLNSRYNVPPAASHYGTYGGGNMTVPHGSQALDKRPNLTEIETMSNQQTMFSPFKM